MRGAAEESISAPHCGVWLSLEGPWPCFSCACLPNLFLPGPAERKAEKKRKEEKKKKEKRTGRVVKSATVHPDLLTGNAESLWLLLLDGQALTKQEEEERGNTLELWEEEKKEISQPCFCFLCFFSLSVSVTFETLDTTDCEELEESQENITHSHGGLFLMNFESLFKEYHFFWNHF